VTIALEAGHGGNSTGAEGLSGLLEKDINLVMAKQLQQVLQAKGAGVIQIRDDDKSMSLGEKRVVVRQSDADLFISIHANAASTRGGYLRVGGTSTYYHNPFWAPFAERVYNRLIQLNIDEFGVIGSFNYRVIRVPEMPSILVEQAFMTHAEDEEKMANPAFRRAMALKISDGIVDYLRFMEANSP
jgi:N-acetylmuramoyl-L-alanine amidase